MPIYKFKCEDHGYFEEIKSIVEYKNDDKEEICPKCGSSCPSVIGAPRVEFNTDGFYCTDSQPQNQGGN